MKSTRITDLLCSSVAKVLQSQRLDGSFAAGHNGPFGDQETNVRNTAHWLVSICAAWELERKNSYLQAAHRATDFLLSGLACPNGFTFHCRSNPEKDKCHGLIGQARAIEGLIAASRFLEREDALVRAITVFDFHPFHDQFGIWSRVEIDGSVIAVDRVFNHQLWFAAIGAETRDAKALSKAKYFLDCIETLAFPLNAGYLPHQVRLKDIAFPLNVMRDIKLYLSSIAMHRDGEMKSVGSHASSLSALSILKSYFPAHKCWESSLIRSMINAAKCQKLIENLDSNKFGWSYNQPGLELAYVGEAFALGQSFSQYWIEKQFQRTYCPLDCTLTKGATDKRTSAARIYEATRLSKEYEVVLPINNVQVSE